MNNNEIVTAAKLASLQTSHGLHLAVTVILCIVFFPAGLIYGLVVWPIIALSNSLERKKLIDSIEGKSTDGVTIAIVIIACVFGWLVMSLVW